jgi:hypothetical protein
LSVIDSSFFRITRLLRKDTEEIVTRALLSLGLVGIKTCTRITFPVPITPDGPGGAPRST